MDGAHHEQLKVTLLLFYVVALIQFRISIFFIWAPGEPNKCLRCFKARYSDLLPLNKTCKILSWTIFYQIKLLIFLV